MYKKNLAPEIVYDNMTEGEKSRAEEVKFFMLSKVLCTMSAEISEDTTVFIRELANILGCNATMVILALKELIRVANRPTIQEIAYTAKMMNYRVKYIENNIMHSRKYYKALAEYTELRRLEPATPRLETELLNEIKKFNRRITLKLTPIFSIYERREESGAHIWNTYE